MITDLFKISKTTLYRWNNEFKTRTQDISDNINYNFESKLITKPIVYFIVSYVLSNAFINIKKIKKQLNKFFPNNQLSHKHINLIIASNKLDNHKTYHKKNYKINEDINKFIIDTIKLNNCLTANDISILVFNEFEVTISLTSIYTILKKNNYIYKKTVININPYSLEDQKDQLVNVYNHFNYNQNDINLNNDTFIGRQSLNINNMNILIKNEMELIKNNKIDELLNLNRNELISNDELLNLNKKELISIDEMSIITNRVSTNGWVVHL